MVVSALVLVYWRTIDSMVATWAGSPTYTHGFVVAPIAAWLIWRDRARIARVPLRPYWPGVTVLAAAGVAWLLSDLALVNVGRQFALVVMIQATILTILGRELAARIVFPLLFLLFAVPAGDFLLPTLMDGTADFTVAALRATGVPVYRDGNHFVIPSGSWSVVEACSGLRYLIASLVGGTLYAYLAYATPSRRAMFISASLVVPIVANWIRAYLIVMIGHLSSNKLAAGIDHFVYGWVFFGAVILGVVLARILLARAQAPTDRTAAAGRSATAHRGACARGCARGGGCAGRCNGLATAIPPTGCPRDRRRPGARGNRGRQRMAGYSRAARRLEAASRRAPHGT